MSLGFVRKITKDSEMEINVNPGEPQTFLN